MPRPRPSSHDTPSRLRQEALKLFLKQGFAATSVREIAAAAGVTIPTLYYHFGSKDGLLGALVEQLIIDGERVIVELTTADDGQKPTLALSSYYDVITSHLDISRLVMVDPSVRSHEAAGHRLADQGDRFLQILTGGSTDHNDHLRANAALGAIRRPLRLNNLNITKDKAQILASAKAALRARA